VVKIAKITKKELQAVKVRVSSEYLLNLFTDGEHHIKITNGVPKDFVVRGIIQDSQDGCFQILFAHPTVKEGTSYEPIIPEMRKSYFGIQ